MAKYTTMVRSIVEQVTINSRDLPITKRVEMACPAIFDFDFPIWLEAYKPVLEKKILMHYFNKEIGFETVGLWKFYLEERLNLIMPYYNNLYQTTVRDYDYLSNVNMTETSDRVNNETEDGKFTGTSENTATSNQSQNATETTEQDENVQVTSKVEGEENSDQTTHNLQSDLPQANYNNLDYGTNLDEGTQNVSKTSTTDTTGTSTTNRTGNTENNSTMQQNTESNLSQTSENNITKHGNENYQTKREGSNGAFSLTDLLIKYRESLLNIDNLIINELSDLFMMIY